MKNTCNREALIEEMDESGSPMVPHVRRGDSGICISNSSSCSLLEPQQNAVTPATTESISGTSIDDDIEASGDHLIESDYRIRMSHIPSLVRSTNHATPAIPNINKNNSNGPWLPNLMLNLNHPISSRGQYLNRKGFSSINNPNSTLLFTPNSPDTRASCREAFLASSRVGSAPEVTNAIADDLAWIRLLEQALLEEVEEREEQDLFGPELPDDDQYYKQSNNHSESSSPISLHIRKLKAPPPPFSSLE